MIGIHQLVYAQPKFKVTREVSNETAFCANDGKIDISITDAVVPVHFSWTGPDGFAETTQNISDLSPGEYNLYVEDGWCRSVSFSSNIIAASGECLTAEHITTKLGHASGNQTGGVALTITGNFADFTFTLVNQAGQELYTTSANISSEHVVEIGGLSAGEYCYVATNGCCKVEGCFTINCILSYTQNMSVKQPENCGESTGSIKLLGSPVLNGTPPYVFNYTDPMGFSYLLPSGPLAGLSNGEYCLIATDANGCQGRICVQIVADNEPVISSETTFIYPDCSGGLPNGSITIAQAGEVQSAFNYQWDNGDYTENDFVSSTTNNLAAGQHCVTITSVEGDCEVERCFEVPYGSRPKTASKFIA